MNMVNDVTATVKGLKETLAQKNIIIKRLQREIEDEKIIK
jgi:hypothetical protein